MIHRFQNGGVDLKKRLFLLGIIFGIFVLLLTACSTEPVYYSKNEVMRYAADIFGNTYKLTETKSYPDDTEEQNLMYEYVFANEKGIAFSVYTYTDHICIDGSEFIFYEKGISNNYIGAVMDFYMDDIQAICESASFPVEITEFNRIKFYLDSYTQIEEAANLITQLDQTLSFCCDYEKHGGYTYTCSVVLYLQPDNSEEVPNWKNTFDCNIADVDLSTDEDARLRKDELAGRIEEQMVNHIKDFELTCYTIPDEILYKYPVTRVSVAAIQGKTEFEPAYAFKYDSETAQYWIYTMDPCQDFAGFPYNYTEKGQFAALVELLGGSYECHDWYAVWQIGGNTWEAWLKTEKYKSTEYYFDDFVVKMNGEPLPLSDPDDKNNGTVSGRAFTAADLERMLNVTITIDQRNATASIDTNS